MARSIRNDIGTDRRPDVAVAIKDGPGDYRAGACNIGPEEIARRRRMGLALLAAAIVLALVLVAIDAPSWTRIALWPVLAGAFTTLEQVRRRFCVAFGMAGVRNFGPAVGHAERIEDDAARTADRRTAIVMVAYCAGAAALVTALFMAVPT
jgi:hypothetical protein